jgi:hypothetical protein
LGAETGVFTGSVGQLKACGVSVVLKSENQAQEQQRGDNKVNSRAAKGAVVTCKPEFIDKSWSLSVRLPIRIPNTTKAHGQNLT